MKFTKPGAGGINISLNSNFLKADKVNDLRAIAGNAFDATNLIGLIGSKSGSKGEIILVKDDEHNLVVPFYWSGVAGEDARMIVDAKKSGTNYSISDGENTFIFKPKKANIDVEKVFADVKAKYPKVRELYLYSKAPSFDPLHQPYVKAFIPVEVGGKKGTISVAPHYRTGGNAFYYTETAPLAMKRELYTDAEFRTAISSDKKNGIAKIYQDAGSPDFLIEMADGSEHKGTTTKNIATELARVNPTLALEVGSLATRDAARARAGLAILGGVDATHYPIIKGKEEKVDDCFIVAPHVGSGYGIYIVEGMNTAGVTSLGLTKDEFLSVVKGESVNGTHIEKNGGKVTKVGKMGEEKDVSGITITGLDKVYTKPGESRVRFKKHRAGAKGTIVNILTHSWGQNHIYTLNLSTNLEKDLNDIAKAAGVNENVTENIVKSPWKINANIVTRYLASAAVIATAIGIAVGSAAANENTNRLIDDANQATNDANQQTEQTLGELLNNNEQRREDAKKLALERLEDESDSAKTFGGEQAGKNADEVGTLVGEQYATSGWDLRGVQELYSKNDGDFVAYEQQGGLNYSVQVYADENEDGMADKDENGNYLMVMQDFTLTQKEVEDAGKTYSYDEATKEGLWSETAKLVVNAAIEAGMPVATLNTDGSYRMNYIYQGGSREAMVEENGENATKAFEASWEDTLQVALENGLAGGDAITNPKDVFKNEEVVYSAFLIAGADAEVLSVSDGMIYIKSADDNNLYTVPTTMGDNYEASALVNSIETAIKNKTVEEYAQASDIFQAVLESGRVLSESALETLNAKYGDMYISHNLSNVNGNRTYYSTILTVDAEGNVKQSYGKEVYKNGAMNTSIAAVLSVDDTIALTGAQKQGYSTGAVHQAEVATEAEIAKSDEKSRA